MRKNCVLTLCLLSLEQRNTLVAHLINNNIEIMMPSNGSYKLDKYENVSTVCCLFLKLPLDEQLDYVKEILKEIDISHFGGSMVDFSDNGYSKIFSNIKRKDNF